MASQFLSLKYVWHLIAKWISLEDVVALERTCKTLHGHLRDEQWWRAKCYALCQQRADFILQIDESAPSFRQQCVEYHLTNVCRFDTEYRVDIWVVGASLEQAKILQDWLVQRERGKLDGPPPEKPRWDYSLDPLKGIPYRIMGSRTVLLRRKKFAVRFVWLDERARPPPWEGADPGALRLCQGALFCFDPAEHSVSQFTKFVERACDKYAASCSGDLLTGVTSVYVGKPLSDKERDAFSAISLNSPSKHSLWTRLEAKRRLVRERDPNAPLCGPTDFTTTMPCVYTTGASDEQGTKVLRIVLEQFLARVDLCSWIGKTMSQIADLRDKPVVANATPEDDKKSCVIN